MPSVTLSFHQPTASLPTGSAAVEHEGVAHLRRELDAKNRKLQETLLSLDNLIAPQDWLDAGDGFPGFGAWRWNYPANRTQDRSHAPLNYLNEEEWRLHVAMARELVTRNHLALGFRDHITNFIGPVAISFVLRGQSPGASASGPVDADGDGEPDVDPLIRECTQVWEEWREFAEWGEGEHDREEECRQRLMTEGECTLRFFVGDDDSDGLPYVRHIEPELIRTPPDHTLQTPWGWGVRTAESDDEHELGLWVVDPANVEDGEVIEFGDYVRVKNNADRTTKRGLSDFFPVATLLRKVLGLHENMAHVARLQAAIAWWEQYPSATLEQVQNQIRVGADYQRLKLPPGTGGANTSVTSYEAGTVVATEVGREVKPGPVSAPDGFARVDELVLRSVGWRFGTPAYFTGQGADSFASVLVTGSPFVRITENRQKKQKGFCCAVAMKVVELAERTGRLAKGASKRVRAVGVCPPVVIADEEKKARTFLSLYQQNCADPIDFLRALGKDPKVVAANIAAWKKKFEPPPQQGASPMGGPMAAPPGSAGGDGSSPNAGAVGEGRRWFGESTEGEGGFTGIDSHGHKWVNGHQVKRDDLDRGSGAPSGGANTSASTNPGNATNSNAVPGAPGTPSSPSATKATSGKTSKTVPAEHVNEFLKTNGYTPGADITKMPEPSLVQQYINTELTDKLRAETGDSTLTVERVLQDPNHPYHQNVGEIVLAAILGGEKGNGRPLDVGHTFHDQAGNSYQLNINNKMAASNAERRWVKLKDGDRVEMITGARGAGHVLVTVGFNPDGEDSKKNTHEGALVARFGVGTTDWPVEDGKRQKIEDSAHKLVVLTRFDSFQDLHKTDTIKAVQDNFQNMFKGFDMDEHNKLLETEASEMGKKVAKGTDPASVAFRQGVINNITNEDELRAAIAALQSKLPSTANPPTSTSPPATDSNSASTK